MVKIMEGVRVVEVASWVYVPMAGAVLAEWGADVIKIEPPQGDPQRGLVSSGMVGGGAVSVNFANEHPNRGKRSVAVNLQSEEGRDLVMQLVATADVFLTNYLPEVRRKLRLDVEDIRAVNPNIIYARGSGAGEKGPEAGRGGYDSASFWARGGSQDGTWQPEMAHPPSMPGGAYGDSMGGLTIAGGISAALLHRDRTGEALVIDGSLLAMGGFAMGFSAAACSVYGLNRMPMPSHQQPPNVLVNSYRTADDRFINFTLLQADRFWPEFVERLGEPSLGADARFATAATRAEHREACVAAIDAVIVRKTLAEWKEQLSGAEFVWAPVQTAGELLTDPQVVANGYFPQVEAADGGTFQLTAAPLQFNGEPSELRRAPELGEHTDETLLSLGLDMDRIIELKVSGAIL